jgi:hypothetical protein
MSVELKHFVEKQLLQHIEETGQLRSDVNLLTICNSAKLIYGQAGTARRREVQIKFDNLKRKSIRSWAKHLDRFEVPYGPATLRALREPIDTPTSESDAKSETSSAEDAESLASDNESFASAFNNISLGTPAPIDFFSPPPPPTKEPDPFITPTRPITMMSPDTAVSFKSAGDSTVAGPSHEGSKTTPHVVKVDINHPERNREFDIQCVPQISHQGYVRTGYVIRVETCVLDVDKWEAKIVYEPSEDKNPSILVRGPGRSEWMNKAEGYHQTLTCDSTKVTHLATVNDIKSDTDRQFSYWLLVFPESVALDNAIFSGDPVYIDSKKVGLNMLDDGVDFKTCIVNWRVADKYGGRQLAEKKRTSVSDMFGPTTHELI